MVYEIRKAIENDLPGIANLISTSLPNDPIIKVVIKSKNKMQFFVTLMQNNSLHVAIDDQGNLIGCISVGNIKSVFTLFIRKLPLAGVVKLISSNLRLDTLWAWGKIFVYVNKSSYFPSQDEISYLAVKPEYRGKRVGKLLVLTAANGLEKFDDCLVAKTLKETPENIIFYRACGMLVTEEKLGRVILKGSKGQICTALKMPRD